MYFMTIYKRLILLLLALCVSCNKVSAIGSGDPPNFVSLGQPSINPNFLPHWRKALAKVLAGTGRAEIQCIGDSITAGALSSNPPLTSPPGRLITLLNNAGIPAREGYVTLQDSRWTRAGWIQYPQFNLGSLDSAYANSTTSSSNPLKFTPTGVFDTIKVIWGNNGSGNTSVINVDGGSSLGTISNSSAFGTQTFSCPRGTHTVNILPPATGTNLMFISGIEVWDSTSPAVSVSTFGLVGGVVASYVFAGTSGTVAALSQNQPDLAIIDLTVNDADAGTTLSTYQANINTLITDCQVSGDCLLVSANPVNPSGLASYITQSIYNNAFGACAIANNCGFVDMWNRWGGNFTTYNGYGYYADAIHPNDIGDMDTAFAVFNAIYSGGSAMVGASPITAVNTVAGSAGNLYWTMPEQSTGWKKVVIVLNGYTDASTTVITFPVPFLNIPSVTANGTTLTVSTISTAAITIPISTTQNGTIIVEGI
jgi:hypothetical protein